MSLEWKRYCEMLRAARERLQNLQVDDPAIPVCIAGLARIESMLRRPLRITMLGEYNSGKTSVTDLLIGKGVLPISVVANTGVPVLVSYGSEPALFGVDQSGISIRIDGHDDDPLTDLDYRAVEIRMPLPWLESHQVLDTPATLTPAAFAAEADICVWCTVATRAWTESERNLWTALPARCHRTAILVATHKDSFYSDDDCAQVLRRLTAVSRGLFRDVILLSAADPEAEASGTTEADGGSFAEDAAALRAAIETSANAIRHRRVVKAKRIVSRFARLTAHEFGQGAVRSEAQSTLDKWQVLSERIFSEYALGRLPFERTIEALLQAFGQAAEVLRPGVVRGAGAHPPLPAVSSSGETYPATQRHAAMIQADLTAVLRILASGSRYESPAAREQREAARATIMALADLDSTFARIGHWLAASRSSKDGTAVQLNA
jgi:hypothetical protein